MQQNHVRLLNHDMTTARRIFLFLLGMDEE